jgi:hypothetical protein
MTEYLMYFDAPQDQGSEGWNSYAYYGVGIGNTWEEAILDYEEKINRDCKKELHPDDPNYEPNLKIINMGSYYSLCDRWKLCIVPLRSSEYGNCKKLEINYI